MFDLDQAVEEWTRDAYQSRCAGGGASSRAELRDHFHCEIERARAEGLGDQAAFAAAVKRMGPATTLAAEHRKNRSALGAVCAAVSSVEREGPRGPRIAHALLWAAAIMSCAAFMARSAMTRESSFFFIWLFAPLWWASDLLLRGMLRARRGGPTR